MGDPWAIRASDFHRAETEALCAQDRRSKVH